MSAVTASHDSGAETNTIISNVMWI